MLYQIAYCDDDTALGPDFAEKIAAAFERRGLRAKVDFFADPLILEERIRGGSHYDALFVDIDMPELNGIALCRRLQQNGYGRCIVFLSNREEMVYQSLQVRPVRFLRKNRFAAEIDESVSALVRQIEQEATQTVALQSGKDVYRLPVRGILYLEITNQTMTVHLYHSELKLKYRMNDAERLLAPYGFLRIHKSYLVNYRVVYSIRRDCVVLENSEELPLSRHRYTEVTDALLRWTKQELRASGGESIC